MSPGRAPLLHVIGAGPWQVPTIRRAQAMGCRVLVSDGFAERPGYAVADLHERVDIVDAEATLALARRHGVDGVLCDTTDHGVFSAAWAAQALSLPGPGLHAARCCTDKAQLAQALQAAGLAVPRGAAVATGDLPAAQRLAAELGCPLVVKPVDNQSGRGVSVVHAVSALPEALAAAAAFSRSGQALLQQQVQGVEVIVDALVVQGQAYVLGIAPKTPYADNPTVSSRICYGQEPPLPRAAFEQAQQAVVDALGLQQGLMHAEYMVSDGQAVVLDVAARGGGVGIYQTVLPHVSGVDVMAAAIGLALGRPPSWPAALLHRAACIEFLRAPAGRLRALEGLAQALAVPGVAHIHLNWQVGDWLPALQHKDHRLGHVIALADTAHDALHAAQMALGRLHIEVDEQAPPVAPAGPRRTAP